ncbi:MAG: proton-conducting transporter membrane subunit, partial [Actinomycetales bacterium]
MSAFPWLSVIAGLPLVGALVVMLTPRSRPNVARIVALVFAVATLVGVIGMALQFDGNSTDLFQFVESYPWIPTLGIGYTMGIDGIALVLIGLAATLVPIVILSAWRDPENGSVRGYFALILALETTMIGVFAATDLFLFYVFFEVMLIPVYFLIGRYGGPQRSYAAVKFLLYSL